MVSLRDLNEWVSKALMKKDYSRNNFDRTKASVNSDPKRRFEGGNPGAEPEIDLGSTQTVVGMAKA